MQTEEKNRLSSTQLHLKCTIKIFLQKTKFMQNNKVSHIPPVIAKDKIITDPKEKAEILNNLFASKPSVHDANDPPTVLTPKMKYC